MEGAAWGSVLFSYSCFFLKYSSSLNEILAFPDCLIPGVKSGVSSLPRNHRRTFYVFQWLLSFSLLENPFKFGCTKYYGILKRLFIPYKSGIRLINYTNSIFRIFVDLTCDCLNSYPYWPLDLSFLTDNVNSMYQCNRIVQVT